MATPSTALWLLAQGARALLTRLTRVRPLALHEPMVPAAGISPIAQTAIERYLAEGRRRLRERVHAFLNWLQGPEGHRATPAEAQRRFTYLRLEFNTVLTQFDLFVDVLTHAVSMRQGSGFRALMSLPLMRWSYRVAITKRPL